MSIEIYKCPNCGANLNLGKDVCDYCGTQYKVKTFGQLNGLNNELIEKIAEFNDGFSFESADLCVGLCYLKLKQYSSALIKFERAIEQASLDSEIYYYKALALLKGRKPFLLNRAEIEKVESCLESATSLKNKAKFYFLWAVVRYDYYNRKYYNVSPDYNELFEKAKTEGLTEKEAQEIYEILGFSWQEKFII